MRRAERQPAGSKLRRSLLTRAVRVGFAANNRRDYEAMGASFHPEVELISPGRGETALGFERSYHGPEGVARFVEQWKAGFGDFHYEVREIADPGGRRFAVRTALVGTIGDSATEMSQEVGTVYTVEDGLVIRIVNHFEWEDALAELTRA